MGFRSGLYGGRYQSCAPVASIRSRTPSTQVVHHHDVVGPERRDEDLIEIGEERVPVHRPVEEAGGGQALHAQGGHERAGLPMMMGRVIVDARAAATPAIAPQQIRRNAAFIEKDEPVGINRRGEAAPIRSGRGDVSAILFGRADRFF